MNQVHQLIKSYGQALSRLLQKLGNITIAEGVLQAAVEKALINWPSNLPQHAVAWLIQVAIRQHIDNERKQTRLTLCDSVAEFFKV